MSFLLSFEHLPDEILIHICQYLHGADILFSFYNLNTRLNTTITGFYRYVNLTAVSYKQFEYAVRDVLPYTGSLVRSFILNGNWETIISKELSSILFISHISKLFPRIEKLVIKWFQSDKLLSFIDTLQNLPELVELDIRFLKGDTIDSLLENIFSANNHRLSIISFDYESVDLNLSDKENSISYTNIEQLTVNLTLSKYILSLFHLIPNVSRLYLSIDELSNDTKCKSIISHLPSLIHLIDFQLRTVNLFWTFEDISQLLKSMPLLQKLTLDLRTDDKRLVCKEDLCTILPNSLIQMSYFIRLYFSKTEPKIEIENLFSSPYSPVVSMLDSPRHRFIIYTIPCNSYAVILPATISKQMLAGWDYMDQTKDLHICDITSIMEILLILQHFRRLKVLTIDAKDRLQILTSSSSSSINLKLPFLKQIEVSGILDFSPILQVAPNVDYIIIYFDCLKLLFENELTFRLLQTKIIRINIIDWVDLDSDLLEQIAQLTSLCHIVITLKDPNLIIDDFVLKILSFWKDKSRLSIDIKGTLTVETRTDLRQWLFKHSHIKSDDSFSVEFPRKSLRRRFKTGKTRRKTKKSSHLARTLITPKQQHSTKLHDSNDVKPIVSKPAYPQSASQKSSSDHTYHLIPSISTEKKMKLFPDTTKMTLPSIVINKPLSTITRFTKKSSVFPVIQEPQQSPEKKKKKGKRIAPWMIVLCSILSCLLVTGIILAIVIPLITKQNETIQISTNSSSTTIPACTAASHTPCSTIILQDINSGLSSTSWTYISCCYIAPTISQSTIEFIIQADSGNWLIDDVSATQGHGELISNGGFEYGITNWTFIVYPNATSTTNVDSVSNNHRTGFAYLYGSSTNAPDYVKQTFSFISGQNILIGFWESYMTSLGGGFGTIELTVTLT
ncbi:hypothetical protein I4U23_010366 [Adineta vaga]|nr:hypothetical protein I4U23_010366 [Adineta vaga]